MSIELSKECDAVMCVLYAEYLLRRSHGASIADASWFSGSEGIAADLLPAWTHDDVATACGRLVEYGYLSGLVTGEDTVDEIELTESGLVFMQRRFHDKRENVGKWMNELVKLGVSVALSLKANPV